MPKNKPRTAEEALDCIENIIQGLPEQERGRLSFYGEVVDPEAEPDDSHEDYMQAIMDLPEAHRRILIADVITEMDERE